jgi:carbonic anhydrase
MNRLLEGLVKFREETFHKKSELFKRLSHGQKPRVLFITCSDSRIDPSLLTDTEPGELFIIRNAGNLVPPYGAQIGGTTATIEYAVAVLNVSDIVVCGHSDCGAMKALAQPKDLDTLPAVRHWLIHAESTRRVVEENFSNLSSEEQYSTLIKENVLIQLDHLRTHPTVVSRLRRKALNLHGWVYSLHNGEVWVYDHELGEFNIL